ncbi:peptidylprolyl isomerase [Sulfuricurvum sp.]|uniref:peptidylprolyl isomerase n=1 Tax=Sulfuricurvum sp. TaxID=2025608 RepID=UPI002606176E|nr:peptidylprolyl isomerase [Sulfuricurvum sp.]MDD2838179.1 peptidylprolyl isomerase [Sulfuricurvum sp.]MDD3596068.1 peptidylprolyl isomerase [Sulfuricurvum sp.]
MKRFFSTMAMGLMINGTVLSAEPIVIVNGETISSEDVDSVLTEGTQGHFDSLPVDKQNELRQRIIEGLITQKLIFDDAQKTGLLDSKEYKEEFQTLVRTLKVQLAAKVWEQQQFDAVKIDPKEIKQYFDLNPDEFIDKEKIHARHILLKNKEEAKAIIESMKKLTGEKLKREFITQAKLKSIAPSANKGGDLGYFSRGQMVASFNDAAFSMKVGTISDAPVQSRYGYHIIYIEDRKAAKKLGYNTAKNFIEERLKMDKFKNIMDKKMATLREKAKITYTK